MALGRLSLLLALEIAPTGRAAADRDGPPRAASHRNPHGAGQGLPSTADPKMIRKMPAHLIVPHDSEQAAVQDAELLAKRPSDNEQWFDQSGSGIGV